MTDLRKAAEMALEVMEYNRANGTPNMGAAIEALRQALAMEKFSEVNQEIEEALKQPQQEPVAWGFRRKDGAILDIKNADEHEGYEKIYTVPLYTTPSNREWVGLTDEEGAEIWGDAHDLDWNRTVTPKEIVKRIEAKLKEKNT